MAYRLILTNLRTVNISNIYPRTFTTSSAAQSRLIDVSNKPVGRHSVALVSLNHPPVNSVNMAMASEMADILKDLESSEIIHGIIMTSSLNNMFCAGLDLHELYNQPREHLEMFWKLVQDFSFRLYSSRLFTVAAINGHCLAGGTIIASACDYRMAAQGDYRIGVTAAKLGIVPPPWFLKMLIHLMGQRQTESALQRGQVFSPHDGIRIGLIDDICSAEDLITESLRVFKPYFEVSHEARSLIKQSLRSELVNNFQKSRDEDIEKFVSFILRDSVQRQLHTFIQSLKDK